MKKVFFIILILLCIASVSAKDITLDDMVNVINNGVITKEYITDKQNEYLSDGETKKWSNIKLTAKNHGNYITIDYNFTGVENSFVGIITATLQEDGKTLKSIIEYEEDENKIDELLQEHNSLKVEVHNMLVYWNIEASDGFSTIKDYVFGDYINKFNSLFDKCYRQEMHACRTYVKTFNKYEYTSDVELSEEASNYVIKKLRAEKREQDNDEMLMNILKIGGVIAVLFVIGKLLQGPKKVLKY